MYANSSILVQYLSSTPALRIQCRFKKFGNMPLGRSSILSVAVAKVDIQPIAKFQLVIASPKIKEEDRRKVGMWFCSMEPYRECRREAEVTGTLTLHASSDVDVRYTGALTRAQT